MALPDDFGNTRETARLLRIGETIHGKFEQGEDIDCFLVRLEAGLTYVFVNDTLVINNFDFDGPLQRMSPGNPHYVTPTETRDYLVSVAARGATGDYSLQVSLAPGDDYAANPAGAGHLPIGGEVHGALNAFGADRDWFSVDLEAGKSYWFEMDATIDSREASVHPTRWLQVLDANGQLVQDGYELDRFDKFIMEFTPSSSGRYYLQTLDFPVYSALPPTEYVLRARLAEADDQSGQAAAARLLSLGEHINGRLELPQDLDLYKLNLEAAAYYEIELHGVGADGKLLADPTASRLISEDQVDYYIHGSYFDALSFNVHKTDAAGAYYVPVSFSNKLAAQDYRLNVRLVGYDDFPDEIPVSVLPVDAKLRGKIEFPGDRDAFAMHLEQGHRYSLDLLGAASDEGSLEHAQSYLTLEAPERYGVYGVTQSQYMFTHDTFVAQTSGDYRVVVSSLTASGSYQLRLADTSGDKQAPSIQASTLPNAMFGNIVLQFSETVRAVNSDYIALRSSTFTGADYHFGDAMFALDPVSGKLLLAPQGPLKPGETYTVSVPAGMFNDMAGNPNAAQSFQFKLPAPATKPSSGDDVLLSIAVGGTIQGGAGIDTVLYHRTPGDCTFGHYGIFFKIGYIIDFVFQDTNYLRDIERLAFPGTRQMMAIDVGEEGHGGQAYRLYQAAFNRSPDEAGVGFWINALDHGATLHQVAVEFLGSAEFKALYGATPSNLDFVNSLYHNVLHREGEKAGVDFWMDVLQQGNARADVLASFSQSAENQASVAQVIGNGFFYLPYL